jgi:hypothetical protein
VVVTPTPGQLEDRRQPTTTLEGWRRFVDADEPTLELLPDADRDALDDAARTGYNEARIAYHAELIVVTTSTIQQILHQGRLLTLLNQREIGARRSLIVAGAAATGKTTAVKQLGRTHELSIRQRYPDCDRIPVVYVTAPPRDPLASWRWSSPASWACHRSGHATTSPTSPKPSAKSSLTLEQISSSSMKSTI